MKEIIISSDGDSMVYLVPDEVADNLKKHCVFFDKWMKKSPNDKRFKSTVVGALMKQTLLII